MRAAAHHRYTWKQYLSIERGSTVKHEFLDGEIFAIAGGTPAHAALSAAVIGELRAQLEGKPCVTFTSDLLVRVRATGLNTYPDASVICGPLDRDPDAKNIVLNPVVLVEVTSGSTEAYDRGEKFEHYQQIPTLAEFVVVGHREQLIEVFRRKADGQWQRLEARASASVTLASIGCELTVDRIYRGIELAEE